ncbi:MAG: hypothetical protein ABR548_05360 [Actinomycetota bacterium]|nr:hypothetical protein [Actinomycetota bacterium]
MHHFAIVALLGLAVYKTAEFVYGLVNLDDSRIRLLGTLALGIVATELLDYSVFAGWGIAVRDSWMGPLFTGLMVGAMSYVWPAVVSLISSYTRSGSGDIDQRTPRAA